MLKNKYLFIVKTLLALALILTPVVALADDYGIRKTFDAANNYQQNGPLPETVAGKKDVPSVIGAIIGYGLSLVGIVFFGLMLYAGFRWMIAMGNTEDVEKAKQTLEAAAIGLVIVLAAYAITSEVFGALAGTSAAPAAPVTR